MIDTRQKVRSLNEALAWRNRQPGPVVFTNGVFDLLHSGHVELLEAARREGNALVVGLNSDEALSGRSTPGLPGLGFWPLWRRWTVWFSSRVILRSS